jgi:hypothetical protein
MRTRPILQRVALLALAGAPLALPAGQGQSDVLVELRDFTPREHRSQAFVLTTSQTLRVEAVGAEPKRERRRLWGDNWDWGDEDERDVWPAAAWILDAKTGEVVWDLRTAETERARNGLRRFDGTIRLPAGVYQAHFGSFPATSVWSEGEGGLRNILRGTRRQEIRYAGPYVEDGEYRRFALTVRGAGRRAAAADLEEAERGFHATTLASLRPGRGASERYGFAIDRASDVEVLGIGEMNRNGDYDYGWIANAETGERVWRMQYRGSEHAGGAHKNRQAHATVRLAPGRYVAYFVSDDSHDPEEWNGVPPVDPEHWGLTLRLADEAARAAVRSFAYAPVPAEETIVSLTGVGHDQVRSEGFTLRKPMDVRVYALGEGRDGEMFDYGWIVDVGTRQRVWTMRYADTEHAGGADKNRLFDGALRLEAGSYLVYYKTDGSHSADDWNGAAPAEGQYWGISVFPASRKLDRAAVAPFERGRGPNDAVLAELPRLGNDERARASFRLDRETTVRIYSLGEGDGEMYDYAWLEDARTRRVVWEMTYRTTEHAGGARKNRVFDGQLRLGPGEYVLRYQSDGSHAYGGWNADPPDDPESWGVTVFKVEPRSK